MGFGGFFALFAYAQLKVSFEWTLMLIYPAELGDQLLVGDFVYMHTPDA